jgi:ribosomal protein S26
MQNSLFSQKIQESQPSEQLTEEENILLDVPKVIRKRPRKNKDSGDTKKSKCDSALPVDTKQLCAGEEAIKRIQMKRIIKLRKAEDLISRTFISGAEKRAKIYEKLLKEL